MSVLVSASEPFLVQQHPTDYVGFRQLALIQYTIARNRNHPKNSITSYSLVVIDNFESTVIKRKSNLLRYLDVDLVDDQVIFDILTHWDGQIPVSVFCSQQGYTPLVTHAIKSLDVRAIDRVIGPAYHFDTAILKKSSRYIRRYA